MPIDNTDRRISDIASAAGIKIEDPAAAANLVRLSSGCIELSVLDDSEIARHLRAIKTPEEPAPVIMFPDINQEIADVAVRNKLGRNSLREMPADRRMGFLRQVTAMVDKERSAPSQVRPMSVADHVYYEGLQGEKRHAAYFRREAGRRALVEHQNLSARLGTIRDPMAKATAQQTMAALKAKAQAGGFTV